MKSKCIALAVLMAAIILTAGLANAHDMWLTLDDPQAGKPLHVVTGYGHAFPADEGTDKEKLVPAYILGPKGTVRTKPGAALDFYSVSPLAAGSYLVVSGRKAQWYTKTPEGTKNMPKNKAPEALRCIRSAKYAKAVLNLDGAKGNVSQTVGQTMEIVPLANPAALKLGQELPVQVLFEGKPLAKSDVYATFAGFSTHKNSFAFFGKTDNDGKAYVKLWHPGLWIVVAKHRFPFANQAECDEDMHAASLTFVLK